MSRKNRILTIFSAALLCSVANMSAAFAQNATPEKLKVPPSMQQEVLTEELTDVLEEADIDFSDNADQELDDAFNDEATAEDVVSVVEPPEKITITAADSLTADAVGLVTLKQANLPENLWENTAPTEIAQALATLSTMPKSEALQNLAAKILLAGGYPAASGTLLDVRIYLLKQAGYIGAAKTLLDYLPQSLQTEAQAQQSLVFAALLTPEGKQICAESESSLAKYSSPFWQRWSVLCQAKNSEPDKALLGLELLREQNEVPVFYDALLQSLTREKAMPESTEGYSIEQLAWLSVAGKLPLLFEVKDPSILEQILGLREDGTKAQTAWKALQPLADPSRLTSGADSLQLTANSPFKPNNALMSLSGDVTNAQKYQAFLTYALNIALGNKVSDKIEQNLALQSYNESATTFAPAWQGIVIKQALATKPGIAALQIIATLKESLASYRADDIGFAVKILHELGFKADAKALANEAIQSAMRKRKAR